MWDTLQYYEAHLRFRVCARELEGEVLPKMNERAQSYHLVWRESDATVPFLFETRSSPIGCAAVTTVAAVSCIDCTAR